MGVATINKPKPPAPPRGVALWHNPTRHHLKVDVREGEKNMVYECEPGGEVKLPAGLTDRVVRCLAPQLVRGAAPVPGDSTEAQDDPTEAQDDPTEEPELGDPEVEGDARSAGDALEAFAQELKSKHNTNELAGMAAELGVAPGGRKIDMARRIAKKMNE